MRKTPFANGEHYHIFNRGTDKRNIFSDESDTDRFFQSMQEFNTVKPIGSIYENSFRELGNPTSKSSRLVDFIAYCTNPNHFHFVLKQLADNGISQFMKRVGGGYAKYYNEKYDRSGTLFQGRFKSVHVNSNEYLLHVSAYVNLNARVHKLGNPTSKLVGSRSSWEEYVNPWTDTGASFCNKKVVLEQFRNREEYRKFAEDSLKSILERKATQKEIRSELEMLLLEDDFGEQE